MNGSSVGRCEKGDRCEASSEKLDGPGQWMMTELRGSFGQGEGRAGRPGYYGTG